MRETRARVLVGAAALLLSAACGGDADPVQGVGPPAADTCAFANPVAVGADPWVIRHGGVYYSVASRGREIHVYRSSKLTELQQNGVRVWAAPDTGWNQANIWAPELHRIDDRWYIYYTGGRQGPPDAPFVYQRSGVLQAVGDDPQGGYTDRGMLYTGDDVQARSGDVWAIDLTVGRLNGQLYALWSGWERNTGIARTPQHLYIARMSNPWTISSNRVKLSSPVEPWERGTELDLQEGPQLLRRGEQLFVIYSTRESWLKEYRLGQLRLGSGGADPMRPESWVKSGPVFAGTSEVHGAGHASFTTSPDGTEDWIVYHSKTSTAPGWDRVIRMQKFGWNPDGSPSFGTPVPNGQMLRVPSGQCR